MPSQQATWLFLADAVLVLHVAFVLFVILFLVLILLGGLCRWKWVRNFWLRLFHLAAIALVTAQSWLGLVCPLTHLEIWLRAKGSGQTYGGSFIGHWLERLLYYEAPPWVFTVAYTLFGLLVVLSWLWVKSRRKLQKPLAEPKI